MNQLLSRDEFRESVLERDSQACVCCGALADAVHHIIDRKCFRDGGYYVNNGASLCEACHIDAEKGTLSCEEIRRDAGITDIVLPDDLDPRYTYDKWGKVLDEPDLVKYPSTQHIEGSGIQKGDSDECATIEDLRGKHLVLEEKNDGANTAISFNKDLELKLQCRGHFLGHGGDMPHFDQFKMWANVWKESLFDMLEDRYIMYGEWMSAFHSVYYNLLPHYFMEFDIYDKKEHIFLDTPSRMAITAKTDVVICSVRVITEGRFDSIDDIICHVGHSAFIDEWAHQDLEQELLTKKVPEEEKDLLLSLNKNGLMEGLYIKWEEDGVVKGRYKFVRPCFVQTILSAGKHWKNRASIRNKLDIAGDERMFGMPA